jgi:ribosomal peptide maturation radical SAM protein 1
MGVELARQFPVMDYVFLGEADRTFPEVVEAIFHGDDPIALPPGVVGPGAPTAPLPPTCSQIEEAADARALMTWNMDDLPYPDFDDYFTRWRRSTLRDEIEPLLFFEMSRGCWWGQKHHCKFCGLNGSTLAYRSKTPDRVMAELKHLVDRYEVHKGCSADNILDHRYFTELLPRMRRPELELAWVCEMKTNLTRPQVEALLDAGMGAAQLGIETFLDPVLRLIGKGATAMHNLQALKWFSEAGIEVKWNLLYGFPGENPDDYAALADLIPSLVHMAPPLATGRVRLDRFSPYFEDPAQHGMINPRPNAAFSYVYPFPQEALGRMAYYYEYDYADGRDPLDYVGPVLEAIGRWQDLKDTVTLRCFDRDDGVLLLHDTRPGAIEFQHRLTGIEREAYLFCDTSRSVKTLWQHLAAEGFPAGSEARLRDTLDQWVDQRLMARIGDRYLSLALRAPAERPAAVAQEATL